MLLYHLSPHKLEGIIVRPWIPDNYMTRHGYEDNKTKRIPVSESIDGALCALPMKRPGMRLWVNVIDIDPVDVAYPTRKEVPDVNITLERWILHPVQFESREQIILTGDAGRDGLEYEYGDGKTAMLYEWEYLPMTYLPSENT